MPKLKEYDLSKVTPIDLAYLAGFVDGEGCFFIGKFNTVSKPTGNVYKNYHCILKISNNCQSVLQWINDTFGGRTTLHNKKTKSADRNFITYDCYFTGNCLTELANLLLPYLKIKQKQAEVMIQMRETFPTSGSRGPTRPSPETEELRTHLHKEMHRLNSRFKNHPLKSDLYQTLAPCCPSDLCGEEVQVD